MVSYFLAHFISCSISLLLACMPFTMMFGTKWAWFSCASMVVPALGYHYSLVYVIFYIFTKSLFVFSFPAFFAVKRLPLFFATWALRSPDKKMFIVVPFGAMVLFVLHPVGFQAWYYSCYWFIPMIAYRWAQSTMIARVIGASFVAHAVGSVIFLYSSVHLTADFWIALIPVVAIERMIIACGMYGCIKILEFVESLPTKRVFA